MASRCQKQHNSTAPPVSLVFSFFFLSLRGRQDTCIGQKKLTLDRRNSPWTEDAHFGQKKLTLDRRRSLWTEEARLEQKVLIDHVTELGQNWDRRRSPWTDVTHSPWTEEHYLMLGYLLTRGTWLRHVRGKTLALHTKTALLDRRSSPEAHLGQKPLALDRRRSPWTEAAHFGQKQCKKRKT